MSNLLLVNNEQRFYSRKNFTNNDFEQNFIQRIYSKRYSNNARLWVEVNWNNLFFPLMNIDKRNWCDSFVYFPISTDYRSLQRRVVRSRIFSLSKRINLKAEVYNLEKMKLSVLCKKSLRLLKYCKLKYFYGDSRLFRSFPILTVELKTR